MTGLPLIDVVGIVWYVYRSSITGKYVSEKYARANPDTTVREKRTR